MEYSIPALTWVWLFVPMPLVIVLSVLTWIVERENFELFVPCVTVVLVVRSDASCDCIVRSKMNGGEEPLIWIRQLSDVYYLSYWHAWDRYIYVLPNE